MVVTYLCHPGKTIEILLQCMVAVPLLSSAADTDLKDPPHFAGSGSDFSQVRNRIQI